jgi:hypothetical protein
MVQTSEPYLHEKLLYRLTPKTTKHSCSLKGSNMGSNTWDPTQDQACILMLQACNLATMRYCSIHNNCLMACDPYSTTKKFFMLHAPLPPPPQRQGARRLLLPPHNNITAGKRHHHTGRAPHTTRHHQARVIMLAAPSSNKTTRAWWCVAAARLPPPPHACIHKRLGASAWSQFHQARHTTNHVS